MSVLPSVSLLTSFSIWTAVAQVLFTLLFGFYTMIARKSNVDGKILKQKFGAEHEKHNMKPSLLSYPDMGNGPYGCALPYKNWFKWNCAMRAHQNACENLPISLVATLGNLYFCPYAGLFFGFSILVTRLLYTAVYLTSPSKIELASRLNTL